MIDAQRIQIPLKKWERIKERWNDAKSRHIESECLEPLNSSVQGILENIEAIENFVISVERQIEDIEDY